MRAYMKNITFSFDHTMRELFEYPDPSFPFITWKGYFDTFAERSLVCHWHNEFEYDVVLSGTLDYYIDGKYIRANKGDIVFINSNSMHMATQVGDESVVLYTISFLPSLLANDFNTTVFKKYFQSVLQSPVKGFLIDNKTSIGSTIAELLYKIYTFEADKPEHYEILCISLVGSLWDSTLHYIKEQKQYFDSFYSNSENEPKVKDILCYIHEHYADDIRIEDLARYAYISRSECFRCFKQYFNKSPIVYLTEYRLSHATKLLMKTEKSITEIATLCGFSTASYFGKQFKKIYGITPLQFRKKSGC